MTFVGFVVCILLFASDPAETSAQANQLFRALPRGLNPLLELLYPSSYARLKVSMSSFFI